jgi:hypothetical protein
MTAPTPITPVHWSDTLLTDPTDASTDATNGNSCPNSGVTGFRFNNTSGSSATVDFLPADATFGPEDLAVANETFTIPTAGVRWIGRRDIATFGRVLTFKTSVSTLKVTAFEP